MNKRKVIYSLLFFVVFAVLLIYFQRSQYIFSDHFPKAKFDFSRIKVTDCSQNGVVVINDKFFSKRNINEWSFGQESLVEVNKAAIEFFFDGMLVICLSGSSFRYLPQTQQIIFFKGEFYWRKETKKKQIAISILRAENVLYTSVSGRIEIKDNMIKIWNFNEEGECIINGIHTQLLPRTYYSFPLRKKNSSFPLFPASESISPDNIIVRLDELSSFSLPISWKSVPGASSYLFRIYPSNLRDSFIYSQIVNDSSFLLDISPFINLGLIYWDVCAYDIEKKIESENSHIGRIRFSGVLPDPNILAKPPLLSIESITISGGVILIRGSTSSDAKLFIEEVPIKIDMEGKFIHTIIYPSTGIKEIRIRAVSPSGITTSIKKWVSVMDETLD